MRKSIWDHFAIVPDPRVARTKKHKLQGILVIAVCAVICGAEHWTHIEAFGKVHEAWFRTFLDLPHGIPSHDTFGRVFAAPDPEVFEAVLRAFVQDLAGSRRGKHLAIDGKTLRHSFDRARSKAPLHMVSAWVHENHVAFGQLAVEAKSNEITAIPELLPMLELAEATVTIDAIGCQKEIARPIVERGGDYVLALKANQQSLHEDVQMYMDDRIAPGFTGEHASGPAGTETTCLKSSAFRCDCPGFYESCGNRHRPISLRSASSARRQSHPVRQYPRGHPAVPPVPGPGST